MKVWRAHELGEPLEVLRLEEMDIPAPGPGQLLVEVDATGVSFGDLLFTRGQYQEATTLPYVPGSEFVGRVVAVGEGVSQFQIGERVCALSANRAGGMAEFALSNETMTFPAGDTMSDAEASVILIAYHTSWFGLHRRGKLSEGETLLVHSAAGGVGSAAVQLGLAAGARVIAVTGGSQKAQLCREMGADVVVDHTREDFVAVVNEDTDGRGADVIYDPVNGDVFDRSRRCIASEGRILVVGFAAGRITTMRTNHALLKNYSVVGVNLTAYQTERSFMMHEAHAELLELHRRGAIAPLIQRIAPFADAPAAIAAIPDRSTWGRVVLGPFAHEMRV
jgi:NADPH2:quinone reductase